MDLFQTSKPKAHSAEITQVKSWVQTVLELDPEIPIFISQLACHEPGCPPIETVIVVMTQPPQQYKLHKEVSAITLVDIQGLFEAL